MPAAGGAATHLSNSIYLILPTSHYVATHFQCTFTNATRKLDGGCPDTFAGLSWRWTS